VIWNVTRQNIAVPLSSRSS